MKSHGERKHSRFSASGAERWANCPGSVHLSEGLPDKDSPWAIEGTRAHEVLESLLRCEISGNDGAEVQEAQARIENIGGPDVVLPMLRYGGDAAKFILKLHQRLPRSEIMVETRIHLPFIHSEMFGTFDGAVVDHFGTLHVFDYKYGAGHAVSPVENLQMIFYGLGLAHQFDWNFKRVRLWIIQPRIKGYDGPVFWELTVSELKNYVTFFKKAVGRVLKQPDTYTEGPWCHWCRAKGICPLKQENKIEKARTVFSTTPIKR